jgi:hypothetical protein
MKKVIVLSFVLVNLVFASFSQSDKYSAAMKSALEEMKTANSADATAAVAAKFERIANAEQTQWLPYYYAALMKSNAAFNASDKDKAAEEVDALIAKAEAISKDNSEIHFLKAMVCWIKMMVDPQSRWMKYGAEATKNLEAAKKFDATNPRPYALEAQSLQQTPEQFGGGCATAKSIAEKANTMFIDFKVISELHPTWGKEIVDGIMARCK